MKKSWIRDDDKGVASTVGTIMALMVFLSFLALFTNQWVPVYMQESEASHVNDVMLSLTRFKMDVDMQILGYRIAQMTNASGYVPPTMYHTVKLGANGIPVFVADTMGHLSLNTNSGLFTIEPFQYESNTLSFEGKEAGGTLDVYMPNRYYIPQRVIYENGGIVTDQYEGSYVKDGPHFSIENSGGLLNISLTTVHLFGNDRSMSGASTGGIHSKLLWVDSDSYNDINGNLNFTISSKYYRAWATFFQDQLSGEAGLNATDFSITTTSGDPEGTVSIEFSNVNNFYLSFARMEVSIGEGNI